MAIHNDGGGEDSEDDDDIVIGVGEDFRKHIDALKRACVLEVGHGGYIFTPTSILSGETPPAFEENEEEEDDDELFLSIKSKYGRFGYGDSFWFGKGTEATRGDKNPDIAFSEAEEEDGEEEDDEAILRSVEKLYKSGVSGGAQLGGLPSFHEVVSTQLTETNDTNDPSKPGVGKRSHPSPSPHASPGCEPGGFFRVDDCGFSPQRSDTGVEQGEEAGRSIASFLPGNWIETDGDVEHRDTSPAGPLGVLSVEQGGSNLSIAPHEAHIYNRPESAHILTDALKKNRQCQRTLRNVLSQVEAKQKENAELQKRVSSLVDFEKCCNRRFAGFFSDQANPSVKLIAAKAPVSQNKYWVSSNKTVSDLQTCGPPVNPDVEIYKKLQKKVSFTFPCRRWSHDERAELAKGVKQQVYEVLVRQAMDTLSNADALDEEFNSLDDHMSKIGGKEFSPQQMRDAVPGIDWAEVARVYVVGRTPEECRTRWINHEDSLINQRPWKKIEDKKLLSIAQQHNFCIWEKIAEQLGTNRTPAECLTRYQRSLNASIMRSNWTPEEDSRLRAAVEEWGENDWSAVAACLEGRNNNQCLMRWYKVLHPTKKKRGRWSVEEDKRLKWAVSVYGPKKWKQIAEHVPGRTDLQCRERWCNVLDPSIKLGEWTEEEDRILEESVARHGPHRWAAVANDLKIRTDNQCCRRWKFLHPEDQPEFQRTVHIRRTALVGNFQGRKKERPRLGPQDFISKRTDFEEISKKPACKRFMEYKPMEKGGDIPDQSMVVDASRERRAARILKRKLARGRKASNYGAQISASASDVQTDSAFMDVIDPVDRSKRSTERTEGMDSQVADAIDPSNRPDKGRKRKAGQISDTIEPSRRSKLKVSRLNQSLRAISSQDTSGESVGPKFFSFLDLVQSLESYGKCCCLLAKEKNEVDRFSNVISFDKSLPVRSSETEETLAQNARKFSNEESNTGPRLMDDSDEESRQRGMSMSDHGKGHFSDEDEEVACATRAVLSWPFLRGVQELFSQGTTYIGSPGGAHLGSEGKTNSGTDPGIAAFGFSGLTELGSQGMADLGCQGMTGLGFQGVTNLGYQERTDFESQGTRAMKSLGRTEMVSEGRIYLGSQVNTDLRPQGPTYSESQVSSQNADKIGTNKGERVSVFSAAVRKPKEISVESLGRTALEPHGVGVGPQRATYLGSAPLMQNSIKDGTNKGEMGSVPSAGLKKPRSKRPARMRGALSWKKS